MKRQVMLDLEYSSLSDKFIVSISNNGSQWTGALVDSYENCKKILDTFIEIEFEDVTDYKKLNKFQKLREKRDALQKEVEECHECSYPMTYDRERESPICTNRNCNYYNTLIESDINREVKEQC